MLFDVTAPDTPILPGVEVPLSQNRVHQQAAYDQVGERIYATQVIQTGTALPDEETPPEQGYREAHGDFAINQVDFDGNVTGVMYVRGFGHGAGLGVENIDGTVWLWLEYDAPMRDLGVNTYGTKIARVQWQDGAILDVGDPGIDEHDPFPSGSHITPSVDTTNGLCAVLVQTGGAYRFFVYDLEEFKEGQYNALYNFPRQQADQWQAWCLYGDYVYQFTGSAYGPLNPPPPDGEGNSYFTVYDIRTGSVVQRVFNDRHTDLEFREPESINVWNSPDGPVLVYGYATQAPPRQMALFGISTTMAENVAITATVTHQWVDIATVASTPETVESWEIIRQQNGTEVVLFSGGPDTLAAEDAFTDTTPPPCVPLVYRLVVNRESGATDTAESPPVAFVPPEGCGGGQPGTRQAGGEATLLGCPQEYRATIHWRGGAMEFVSGELGNLTQVSWGRTLNDIADAQITVQKGAVSPECCELLGLAEPWVHELTIYRDTDLVWQGPILRTTETRENFVIESLDVFAWLDHMANTWRIRYVDATADAAGRRRGSVTYIAWNILRLNLVESSLSVPPDYAGLMDYIVRRDPPETIRFEKDGSTDEGIWTEYVGNIWRELGKRGLTWTTVGRSLVLRAKPDSDTRAQVRLTLADVIGDVELIRDGEQAATYGFATNQQDQNITAEGSMTVGTGRVGTPYGRLDTLVRITGQDTEAADLRQAAREAIAGRYPVPIAISVPQGSQLSPDAPVTIHQLVPGERYDVLTDTYCTPVSQGFILTDVEAMWEAGNEKVAITLVPLADIDEELE